MALPSNIHELIHRFTVEWKCIEFKEGKIIGQSQIRQAGTKWGLSWDQVTLAQTREDYLS